MLSKKEETWLDPALLTILRQSVRVWRNSGASALNH